MENKPTETPEQPKGLFRCGAGSCRPQAADEVSVKHTPSPWTHGIPPCFLYHRIFTMPPITVPWLRPWSMSTRPPMYAPSLMSP